MRPRPLRWTVPPVALLGLLAVAGCAAEAPSANPPTADPNDPTAAGPTDPIGSAPATPPEAAPAQRPAARGTPAAGSPTSSGPSTPRDRPRCPSPTHEGDHTVSATQQARLSTRLIAATWRADAEAVRALITRGADVNAKDDTEQSAYLVTTSEGYPRLLDLMLCHGADVSSLDSYHGTGLIRAAERGHADVVGRLLRTPIAVDHVNNLGWTALHEAVILGDGSTRYVDTVRALVAGGADIGIPAREDGMTALQHARAAGQHAVAGVLRAPAASDERNRARAAPAAADHLLLRAAGAGDASAVALALRQGARLEARDGKGRTALLRAALRDRVDVARLLVALGADPNAQDARRDSAWLVTGVTGSVPMLETLLPADPDLSLTNRFGGVSLIPASERGHVSYVRRVVQTGIDVNHVNDLGWTALLEAVILGDGSRPYQQVVRTLLDAGADPTLADGAGVTPEQHARDQGQDEVARIIRLASRDRTGRR